MDFRIKNGGALPPFPFTVITESDKFHSRCLMNWVEETHTKKLHNISNKILIPVSARSKAWVCCRSPAEIVGSNPTGEGHGCLPVVSVV
jgi:hypothetical protein